MFCLTHKKSYTGCSALAECLWSQMLFLLAILTPNLQKCLWVSVTPSQKLHSVKEMMLFRMAEMKVFINPGVTSRTKGVCGISWSLIRLCRSYTPRLSVSCPSHCSTVTLTPSPVTQTTHALLSLSPAGTQALAGHNPPSHLTHSSKSSHIPWYKNRDTEHPTATCFSLCVRFHPLARRKLPATA